MSENIVPLHKGARLPQSRMVERLRFLPSEPLAEHLNALISPEEQLGRHGLFLYSRAYQEISHKRLNAANGGYNHQLRKVISDHKNVSWQMPLREHFAFGVSGDGTKQIIELYVEPHKLLRQQLHSSPFINDVGAISVLASIDRAGKMDDELTKGLLELRKFVINGRSLGGPNMADKRRLSPNKLAQIERVSLIERRMLP